MNKYFHNNRIEITASELDNSIISPTLQNDKYTPLTQAQSDFHDLNENASVQEIINCEITPPYIDNRTQAEKRQEQYVFRIPIELSQAFITYRAEAVAYRLENNEPLALIADSKANEKAQEIAAIKEQIRIEYPD